MSIPEYWPTLLRYGYFFRALFSAPTGRGHPLRRVALPAPPPTHRLVLAVPAVFLIATLGFCGLAFA